MAYNRKDFFFKKAKKENFAARSIFKLEEIDAKYKIVHSGNHVIDLGAAPGSWSQYLSRAIGPKGKILGVDLQPVRVSLSNATFIEADMTTLDFESLLKEHQMRFPVDLVVSDMAPRTTGIRITDQERSYQLSLMALETAEKVLKPGGHFVAKIFHGDAFEHFRDEAKKHYQRVEFLRPKSTRKESKEIFLIAMHKNH